MVLVNVVAAPWRVKLWVVAPMMAAAVGVIVLTLSVPAIDTVVPLSVMMLSPMAEPEVNLDSVPIVPPGVVTPPPIPTQLAAVVQTS